MIAALLFAFAQQEVITIINDCICLSDSGQLPGTILP